MRRPSLPPMRPSTSHSKRNSATATLVFMFAFLLTSLAANAQNDSHGLQVVTSIRPLALIVEDIVGEHGEAVALIDAGDSPHHYALTPSARLQAARADFLVWVGAELEVSLTGLFASSPDVISAEQLPGIVLHDLGGHHPDLHLWLNTDNARLIAKAIAARATEQDPLNADYYARRLSAFEAEQLANNEAIAAALARADLVSRPYAVYHDAYQYFERQFGVSHAVGLVEDPERAPSIRELAATRAALAEAKPVCLLFEPDSDRRLIETALNSTQLRQVEMDILGYRITRNSSEVSGYGLLMRALVDDLLTCLRPEN